MSENEKEHKLKLEVERLHARLIELEETVASICIGSADTILISTVEGEKVYTLKTAEQPYRLFVEGMNQGAALLSEDDTILYCNQAFADIVEGAAEAVVGKKIQVYLAQACHGDFNVVLHKSREGQVKLEQDFSLQACGGSLFAARFSFSQIRQEDFKATCLVITSLI
jgi:PAS domain S-box-containing protein